MPTFGEHLRGRLCADDEDATHAAGRTRLIDRVIAISPIHLLQLAVAQDGHQLIFVPGRPVPSHHLLNLWADDRPDFLPTLTAGFTQDGGMLFGTERTGIGVVV